MGQQAGDEVWHANLKERLHTQRQAHGRHAAIYRQARPASRKQVVLHIPAHCPNTVGTSLRLQQQDGKVGLVFTSQRQPVCRYGL